MTSSSLLLHWDSLSKHCISLSSIHLHGLTMSSTKAETIMTWTMALSSFSPPSTRQSGDLWKRQIWPCHFLVQLLSHVWPCDPMDCCMPGFPVHHQLPELAQTHVRWVNDAIQPSPPLSSPSRPAFNLSQHHGLFQGVSSSHQVAKVLEFQLQPQSFQWILRVDFL